MHRCVVAALLLLAACSPAEPPPAVTTGLHLARIRDTLDRSAFTLQRDGEGLHLVVSPCYTRPAKVLVTDFPLQAGQTFTREPDHHFSLEFELRAVGADAATFAYTQREQPPHGMAQMIDRGEFSLPYRQRERHYADAASARDAALSALHDGGTFDVEHAQTLLDRARCDRWTVRVPRLRAAPAPAPAGGDAVVTLDMGSGAVTIVQDD